MEVNYIKLGCADDDIMVTLRMGDCKEQLCIICSGNYTWDEETRKEVCKDFMTVLTRLMDKFAKEQPFKK